ncbi:u3 small nucleolar RNA-associated protein 14 A [Trichonephila clavata]|uniref:U3 small nucleolar RNA-associated protein 14 A n=1 Tax=Trichonephila clavata TaxID=2740835 RepID=A0A8X6KYX7_TRICU|nr:u3 small nucleolar RNA-associated protein 14 A [Trichonephila clavata]
MLRKEKVNKLLKEVEELEKVDPEKALEKIMEADRVRIMERVTLKHTNTGKWAKMQKLRAKYNPDARRALKEDIITGRKLKEKLPVVEEIITKLRSNSGMPTVHEIDDSIYNDGLLEDVTSNLNTEESGDIVPFLDMDNEAFIGSSKQNKVSVDPRLENAKDAEKSKKNGNTVSTEKNSDFIDMDFISNATVLDSNKPSSVSIGDHLDEVDDADDSMDEEESEGVKNVSEAFADEDIIAEFREDKKVAEEAKVPKELDLFLPGWGSWGGKGINTKDKIRQRFERTNGRGNHKKKNILAASHKVFDPLGITGPVLLLPKLWLQSLWRSEIGWDQKVDIKTSQDFLKWLKELEYLKHVQVPRWLHCDSGFQHISLHFFCDANKFAYSAVVFLRVDIGSTVHIQLSIINARPLTYIHEDPNELLPLFRAMFIHGNSNCETPDLDQVDRSSLVKRTKYLQKLREDLRQRFRNEYLALLVHRGTRRNDALEVGDVVLFGHDNVRRIDWPLGVVLEVYPSKDGVPRVARIRTSHGKDSLPVEKTPESSTNHVSDSPTDYVLDSPVESTDNSEEKPPIKIRLGRTIKIPRKLDL